MEEYKQLHFAFTVSTLMICFTVMMFSLLHRRTEKPQNKFFLSMITIIALNCGCEIAVTILAPMSKDSHTLFVITDYMRLIYFLFHNALAPLFFYYVACVCGAISRLNKPQSLFYSSIFLLSELAVALNPLTRWVYTYDSETLEFKRQWAESTIYISGGVYFCLAAMMLMFSWDALTKRRRVALLYFVGITVTGVTIQLFNVVIKTELFSEALSLLGVMISIESEEDRIDAGTGVYNRMALENDLDTYLVNKRVLQLVCIKITNSDVIERSVNMENGETMQSIVAEFLKKHLPRYSIYLASPSAFMLTLFDYTQEETDELTDAISTRFDKPWHFKDTIVLLNVVVMSAELPLRIASSSDALYMADSPVPTNIEKSVLKGGDLDYLLRRAAVEKAIARGIEEHTFEVYYQPTYHIDGTLHGAEALLRLHDSILGHVYPSEFIPVAEHIGMIDELDDFVLKEVCDFLKTGEPSAGGVECINVNLSVLQCMRPGFVERIIDIVNGSGINKRLINFEITESVAAEDYRLLSKTVNALKREGFLFSMDDYGTGYSNIQSVFSLNFDIIKIDKSILWSAEKNELGRIILENTVRMIKQMGRQILVEGVETQAQLDLLKQIGVDYLQGYFFSRPIPKDNFIRLIANNRSPG